MSTPSNLNEHSFELNVTFNSNLLPITKRMKRRQTKSGTILSEPDLKPFERLVSEQEIVGATPECKLVDIEKIEIVCDPFPYITDCFLLACSI